MLIAAIISLIVLVLLCAFLDVYFLCIEKRSYETRTRVTSSIIVVMHLFFLICGPGVLSIAIYTYAFQGVNDGNIPFLYVGIGTGLIMLSTLFPFLSYCDGINNDVIYIRRVFKIKQIKIADIRTIDIRFDGAYFISEINGFSFAIRRTIQNREKFLSLLKERKGNTFSLNPYVETKTEENDGCLEDNVDRETFILNDIGKRYRENYPLYRKTQIIKLSVIMSLVFSGWLAGSIVLIIFYFEDFVGQVLLGMFIVSIIFFVLWFDKYLKDLKTDLKHDNKWLGYKYRFKDKRVVGTAKKKRNLRLELSATLLGLGVFTSITTWLSGVMPDYSDKGAIIAFWICIGLIPVSLICALISFILFKKESKNETIIL